MSDPEAPSTHPGAEAGVDTGAVPEPVVVALTAYAADPGRYAEALAALQTARVLVPLVEVAPGTFPDPDHDHDHDHRHGHGRRDRTDVAAVSLRRADGRRALLAFTGLEPLHRWNRLARPLPLTTGEAARTALRDGASALVVDVAGPVTLVLEGPDLTAVASGWRLGRVGDDRVWIAPAPE